MVLKNKARINKESICIEYFQFLIKEFVLKPHSSLVLF